jgi:hypothetical protein
MRKYDHFNTQNKSIPFGKIVKNIGDAIDVTTGIFTAPITGTYMFIFDGRFPNSGDHLQLGIFINGYEVTGTWKEIYSSYVSQPLIKPLEKGDQVYIKMQEGHKLWNDDINQTDVINDGDDGASTDRLVYFMGILLEE